MKTLIEKPQNGVELTVKLSESERVDRASRCSIQMVKLDAERDEAKAEAAKFRAKIKPLADEVRALSVAYTSGEEKMTVNASRMFDIASGRTWISYNGQQFEEREITKYEMAGLVQKPLFPERENAASAKEIDFERMASTPEQDLLDVIHEEQSVKTKVDHTTTPMRSPDDDIDEADLDADEEGEGL